MRLAAFFTVTQHSLYLAALDERGQPYLMKLLRHDDDGTAPGSRTTGELLAVTAIGAFFYHQDFSPFSRPRVRPQRPEEVNVGLWSGGTSNVVGLFLEYGTALACFQISDAKPLDPAWRNETEAVLNTLGDNHPKFVLSDHAKLRFSYSAA